MRDRARVAVVAALLLAPAATRADPDDARVRATKLLDGRAEALGRQHDAAERTVRAEAALAYKLARRRELRAFADVAERSGTSDLAILALSRGLDEARRLERERDAVVAERSRLDSPEAESVVPPLGAMDAGHWSWPLRGAVIATPGTRREAATGVELDPAALEILARADEPVRAPSAGVVRRIEVLADGRSAVVLAHGSRWVSVLAGLRGVTLAPWDLVDEGAVLGLAARNGDGAAVVTFGLWRTRAAGGPRGWVDPRTLVGPALDGPLVAKRR